MLFSKYGYRKNHEGQWTIKLVSELNNSRHYLLIKCDDCGKLFKTMLNNRNKRLKEGKPDYCNSCAKSGKRNSAYGKDRAAILEYARQFNKHEGRPHSVETRKKMSAIKAEQIANGEFDILSNNRGHKSWYTSSKSGEQFHADSALERFRMIQLDADKKVNSWTKRHHIKIGYTFNGVTRYCIPDFLINGNIIEEVKGRVTPQELAKKAAIEQWCKDNGYGFRFVTQTDLNKNGEYRKFLKECKK